MSVPLATLRRHSLLVWLHDGMRAPVTGAVRGSFAQAPRPTAQPARYAITPPLSTPAPRARPAATPPPAQFAPSEQLDMNRGRRLEFQRPDDAASYLRHWKSDVGAVMALRSALQRLEPSAPVFSWSDDQVLDKLASRIAQGAVVATESARPPALAVMPSAPAAPAVVEPPAVPVSRILATPAPPPPLLPLLEEVQIEGAEVLPEIEQSLEQVDLTIGEIKVAPVSLAPTPSKVPAIETAMTDAGASVTSSLDKL
ncbi:MAG: hypothetical protein V4787_24850 [Pseudomonadota bacterium]